MKQAPKLTRISLFHQKRPWEKKSTLEENHLKNFAGDQWNMNESINRLVTVAVGKLYHRRS